MAACRPYADGKPCAEKDTYKDAACTVLKLTFSKPAPYFHTVMGLWVTYPAKGENIAASEIWLTTAKYQIGNGPYVMKTSSRTSRRVRGEPELLRRQGKD